MVVVMVGSIFAGVSLAQPESERDVYAAGATVSNFAFLQDDSGTYVDLYSHTDSSFSYGSTYTAGTKKYIHILPNFTGTGSGARTITVTFNSLAIPIDNGDLPGMVRSVPSDTLSPYGGCWTFDSNTLPDYLKSAIIGAVWTPVNTAGAAANIGENAKKLDLGTGYVTYTIAPSVDELTLDILVGRNPSFITGRITETVVMSNPIVIAQKTSTTTSRTATVSKITIQSGQCLAPNHSSIGYDGTNPIKMGPSQTSTSNSNIYNWRTGYYTATSFYRTLTLTFAVLKNPFSSINLTSTPAAVADNYDSCTVTQTTVTDPWDEGVVTTATGTETRQYVLFKITYKNVLFYSQALNISYTTKASSSFQSSTTTAYPRLVTREIPNSSFYRTITSADGRDVSQTSDSHTWSYCRIGSSLTVNPASSGYLDIRDSNDYSNSYNAEFWNTGQVRLASYGQQNPVPVEVTYNTSRTLKYVFDFTDSGNTGVATLLHTNFPDAVTLTNITVTWGGSSSGTSTLTSKALAAGQQTALKVSDFSGKTAPGSYFKKIEFNLTGTIRAYWYNQYMWSGQTLNEQTIQVFGYPTNSNNTSITFKTTATMTDNGTYLGGSIPRTDSSLSQIVTALKISDSSAGPYNLQTESFYVSATSWPTQTYAGDSLTGFKIVRGAAANYNYSNTIVPQWKGVRFFLREDQYIDWGLDTAAGKAGLVLTSGIGDQTVSNGGLQITYKNDTSGYRYWIIDAPNVYTTAFYNFADMGIVAGWGELRGFNASVKKSIGTGSLEMYRLVNMMPLKSSAASYIVWSRGTNEHLRVDPYNLSGQGTSSSTIAFNGGGTTKFFNAKPLLTVSTAARLVPGIGDPGPWTSYNYQTGKSIVALNPEAKAGYRINFTNLGSPVTQGTAIVPIPKRGEYTAAMPVTESAFSYAEHLQAKPFEWSADVTAEIVSPPLSADDVQAAQSENATLANSMGYTTAHIGSPKYSIGYMTDYSRVTTDDAKTMDLVGWKTWDQVKDHPEEIRAVKIVANYGIWKDNSDDVTFPFNIASDPEKSLDDLAGSQNVFASYVYRAIAGASGVVTSEPVAMVLKTGVVKGQVFDDVNRNGVRDDGEPYRSGVTVEVFKAGAAAAGWPDDYRFDDSPAVVTATTQLADGQTVGGYYAFMGLDKNQPVDVRFTNPAPSPASGSGIEAGELHFSPTGSTGKFSRPDNFTAVTHEYAWKKNVEPSTEEARDMNAGVISPSAFSFRQNYTGVTSDEPADIGFYRFAGEQIIKSGEQTGVQTLVEDPVRDGTAFQGWFTAANGGSAVSLPLTVPVTGASDAYTYYARWKDSVAPVTVIAPQSGSWLTQNTQVSLTATDTDKTANASGAGIVTAIKYRIDDGEETTYQGAFQLDEDGPHTVTYRAQDAVGNLEATQTAILSRDTKNPSTGVDREAGEWLDPTDAITLTAEDPDASETASGSGIARVMYRFGTSGSFKEYEGPLYLSDAGITAGDYTLQYYAVDVAGNQETQRSVALKRDSVLPATGLQADATANASGTPGGSVALAWDAPADLGTLSVSYLIYRYTGELADTESEDWGEPITSVSGIKFYSDDTVDKKTTYSYMVVPVTPSGRPSPGVATSVFVPASKPSDVRGLTLAAIANEPGTAGGHVDLSWTEPADNGGDDVVYDVYRVSGNITSGTNSSWNATGARIASGIAITTFTDGTPYPEGTTALAKNTRYSYKVVARTASGGAAAGVISANLLMPATAPSDARELAATPGEDGVSVGLTWAAPADRGGLSVRYDVYYRGIGDADEPEWIPASAGQSVDSASVTGLLKNTEYEFLVVALNDTGAADGVTVGAVTASTAPDGPTGLTAAALEGGTSIDLAWAAPADTGGLDVTYKVEVYEGESGMDAPIKSANDIEGTTYTVTGLSKGTDYFFLVYAVNTHGASTSFAMTSCRTLTTAPGEARNLTGTALEGGKSVALTWDAPEDGGGAAVSYEVAYSEITQDSEEEPEWTTLEFGGDDGEGGSGYTAELGVTVSALKKYTDYRFRVTARNDSPDAGGRAEPVAADVMTLSTAPGQPKGFAINATDDVTSTEVTLSWTKATNDLSGGLPVIYKIAYQNLDAGDPDYTEYAGEVGETTVTISGLEAQENYRFRLTPYNAHGREPDDLTVAGPSAYASGQTNQTVPDHVTSLTAVSSADGRQIIASWEAPEKAGGFISLDYKVQYSPDGVNWLPSSSFVTSDTEITINPSAGTFVPGSVYYVRVLAHNAKGDANVTVDTPIPVCEVAMNNVPSQALNITATALDSGTGLAVSWDAPESSGGAVVSYKAEYRPANGSPDAAWTVARETQSGRTLALSGLSKNTAYEVRVTARNAVGDGMPAVSEPLTTLSTKPSDVRDLAAAAQDGGVSVKLTWTAPADRGGLDVRYDVYYRDVEDSAMDLPIKSANDVEGTTYTVAGLRKNTAYEFLVVALNDTGAADGVTVSAITSSTAPGEPAALTASALEDGTSIALTWEEPAETGGLAVTYKAEYKLSADQAWTTLASDIQTTGTSVTGLNKNTAYDLRVTASNTQGASGSVSVTDVVTLTTAPSQPTGFSGVSADDGAAATLSWSQLSYNQTGGLAVSFRIEYRLSGSGGEWTDATADALAVGQTYKATGLGKGKTYEFRLTPLNSHGQPEGEIATAGPSATCEVATAEGAPSAVQSLTATYGAVETQILLTWDEPQESGGGKSLVYQIEHKLASDDEDSWSVDAAGRTTTSYAVTGLYKNKAYDFKVTAKNGSRLSDPATASLVTLTTAPAAPVVVIGTVEPTGAGLIWMTPDDGGLPVTYEAYYIESDASDEAQLTDDLNEWTPIDIADDGAAPEGALSGLDKNHRYWVRVVAHNSHDSGGEEGAGSSSAPAYVNFTTQPTAPGPATSGSAVVYMKTITVSWEPPEDTGGLPVSYKVDYRPEGAANWRPATESTVAHTYQITGLTKGSTYEIRVIAKNATGQAEPLVITEPLPTTVPSAPRNLEATTDGSSVTLTWDEPEDDGGSGVSYILYHRKVGANVSNIQDIKDTAYTLTGLEKGASYEFYVAASNEDKGLGASSDTVTVTVALTAPSNARNLTVTNEQATVGVSGKAGLTLGWTAPADNGGGSIVYDVYRAEGARDLSADSIADIISGGALLARGYEGTSLLVSGLEKYTEYTYLVVARNSALSASGAMLVNRSAASRTTVPGSFAATQTDDDRGLHLTWTAPDDVSNTMYTYSARYRRTDTGAGTWTSLFSAYDSGATSYDVGSLVKGGAYEFELWTVNTAGSSEVATAAAVVAETVPGSVTRLTVTPAGVRGRAVSLTWNAPSDDGGSQVTYVIGYKKHDDENYATAQNLYESTSYTLESLENGEDYDFMVTAVNDTGNAEPAAAELHLPYAAPTAPQDVTVTDDGQAEGHTARVTWTRPADDGAGDDGAGDAQLLYDVLMYHGTAMSAETAGWQEVATGTELTTATAEIDESGNYSFLVRAYNIDSGAAGKRADSPAVIEYITTRPDDVTDLTAAAIEGGTEVLVSWTAPQQGDLKYLVYARTGAYDTPGYSAGWEQITDQSTSELTAVTHAGISRGRTYSYSVYTVSASDTDGVRSPGRVVTLTVPVVPPEPAYELKTSTIAGGQGIKATWRLSPDNGGETALYDVALAAGADVTDDGSFANKATGVTSGAYSMEGIEPGQVYTVRVTTYNSAGPAASTGESPNPIYANHTLPALPPSAVTGLTAGVTGAAAELAWTASSFTGGAPVTYEVAVKEGVENDPDASGFETLAAAESGTAYTAEGLGKNKSYTFRVTAQNSAGKADPVIVQVRVDATAPGSVSAGSIGLDGKTLSWAAPGDTGGLAVTYDLYRHEGVEDDVDASGWMRVVRNLAATSYTDSALVKGNTYSWYIEPHNTVGYADATTYTAIVATTPPSAPLGFSASSLGSSVKLVWSAPTDTGTGVAGAVRYKIWYTTAAAAWDDPAAYDAAAAASAGEGAGDGPAWITLAGIDSELAATTYTHTDVSEDNYTYKLVATNGQHDGAAAYGRAAAFTNLDEVGDLNAEVEDRTATLTWTKPVNASEAGIAVTYSVYRYSGSQSDPAAPGWQLLANNLAETTYVDSPLNKNATYSYKIIAKAGDMPSDGRIIYAVVDPTEPSAARNLTLSVGTGILLSWDVPTDGGGQTVYYDVYRSAGTVTDPESASWGAVAIAQGLTDTSYNSLDTDYRPGRTYSFKVVARNAVGEAEGITGTVTLEETAPGAVLDLTVSAIGTTAQLSWTAPEITGDPSVGRSDLNYTVYMKTGEEDDALSTGWTRAGSGSDIYKTVVNQIAVASYQKQDLAKAQTYTFKVVSYNTKGESPGMLVMVTLPQSVPSAVRNLSTSPTGGGIIVSWSEPSDSGGADVLYDIYAAPGKVTAADDNSWKPRASSYDGTTYTVTGLTKGAIYSVKVVPRNSLGVGPAQMTNDTAGTTAPSGFDENNISVTAGDTSAYVSWTAPADGGGLPVVYDVYAVTAADAAGLHADEIAAGSTPAATDLTARNARVDGLEPETDYAFVVTARNTAGGVSALKEGTTTTRLSPDVTSLAAVLSDATANGLEGGAVLLTWKAPAGESYGEYAYDIYQYEGTAESVYAAGFEKIHTVDYTSATDLSYKVETGLAADTTYTFKVVVRTGTDGASEGVLTTIKNGSATPDLQPPIPPTPARVLVATPLGTTVVLQWSPPKLTGGQDVRYKIYRAAGDTDSTDPSDYTLIKQNYTDLTYTDTSVKKGQIYTWLVVAGNDQGDAVGVYASATIDRTVASAPTALVVTPGSVTAELAWTEPADKGGNLLTVTYDIHVDDGASEYKANEAPVTKTSYTLTGLTRATAYTVRIVAVNTVGESEALTGGFTTQKTVPAEVTAPTAAALTGGRSVALTWGAPADDGGADVSYKVYTIQGSYEAGDAAWATVQPSAVLEAPSDTPYTVSQLNKGTAYSFKIVAENEVGASAGVVMKVSTLTTAPGPVRDPIALPTEDGTGMELEWTRPSDLGGHTEVGYDVYYAIGNVTDADSEAFALSRSVPATSAQYVNAQVTGLAKGREYTFKIVAVGTVGPESEDPVFQISTATLVRQTTKTTAPGAPESLTGTAVSGTHINLTWAQPTDLGGESASNLIYTVYIKKGAASADGTGWTSVASITDREYEGTDLEKYTQYSFMVSCANLTGSSSGTAVTLSTPATAPVEVTGIQTSVDGQDVTISWAASVDPGAAGVTPTYRVYRYDKPTADNGGKGVLVATTTDVTYLDEGLAKGKTYTYTITTDNGVMPESAGNGATRTATIARTEPSAAQNLKAVGHGQDVTLSWARPADDGGYTGDGASGVQYEIYRVQGSVASASDPAWSDPGALLDSAIEDLTYEDSGLTLGDTYTYKVVAKTTSGYGPGVIASVTMASEPPSEVGHLTASTTDATTEAFLAWNRPDNIGGQAEALRYRIYATEGAVTDASAGAWDDSEIVKDDFRYDESEVSWTVKGLKRGVTYTFAVEAYNSAGNAEPELAQLTLKRDNPGLVSGAAVEAGTKASGEVSVPTAEFTWVCPDDDGDDRNGTFLVFDIYTLDAAAEATTAPAFEAVQGSVRKAASVNEEQGRTSGSYTLDTGLVKGASYWFYIVARNRDDATLHSGAVALGHTVPFTVPGAVRSLKGSAAIVSGAAKDGHKADLTWSAPADDGGLTVTYDVYRLKSSASAAPALPADATKVASDLSGRSYTDNGLPENTTYWYYVVAANSEGEAAPATVKVTTSAKAPAPTPKPTPVKVSSVSISGAPATFAYKASGQGNTAKLAATALPANAANKALTWKSSNPAVATVDAAGLVTFKGAEGVVQITATAADGSGKSATAQITAVKNVTAIRTPLTKVYLQKGKSLALPVVIDDATAPKLAVTAALTWTSSKPAALTVSATGKIKASKKIKKKTTVTVTARAANGKTLTVKVFVVPKAQKLKKVTAKFPKSLKVGKTYQLKVKLTKATATGVKVTYKASPASVLKVDKAGKVFALKKGKATITIKAGGKKVKSKKITVK